MYFIIRILKKYKDWKSIVIGDEPREKYSFKHNRLFHLGWITHDETMNIYKKSSISVVPSHWEEPFGRTSLEASANGCAVIISNRGGLPETLTNGIILKNLNVKEVFKRIEELIINKNKRELLQKLSYKNFYLTHKFVSNQIDNVRCSLSNKHIPLFINKDRLNSINSESYKCLVVQNYKKWNSLRLL